MKPNLQRVLLGLVVLALIQFVVGCASCKPGKNPGPPLSYKLKVAPGESLKDSSVRVDVVGILPTELQKWQVKSLRDYWKPGDPLRQDAAGAMVTTSFTAGQQTALEIAKNDPRWTQWLNGGVQYLVVIADLPGVFPEGRPGSQDPRRQLVPLCKCYWPDKTQDLSVEVLASGIRLSTLPREGWTLPAW